MSEGLSKTESVYIPFRQANVLDRTSNQLNVSFWHTAVGGSMPHKSLASSPALKGGASARQGLRDIVELDMQEVIDQEIEPNQPSELSVRERGKSDGVE